MKKLLSGISSGIVFMIASVLIGLFTAPYYINEIGKEAFGIFYLINNLIVWTGLLNGGLRASFKIQLAAKEGKGENAESLTNTIFFTQFSIALLISIAGFIASFFLSDLIPISNSLEEEAKNAFVLLSISFGCSLISQTFSSYLSVHTKDNLVYSFKTILAFIQAAIAISLLSFGWGMTGLCVAALLSEVTFLCLMFFLVYKNNSSLFHLKFFSLNNLRESFSIGKWFLAGFLAQLLIRHTDLLIIHWIEGVSLVAAFIFSSKLYVLALSLFQMMLKVSLPQLTKRIHRDPRQAIRLSLLLLKFSSGYILLSGISIFVLTKIFISWWIGPSYFLGEFVNLMLALSYIFTCFNLSIRTILTAEMQLKKQKISILCEGLLHVLLSAFFGKLFGLEGFFFGLLLSSFAAFLFSVFQISYLLTEKRRIKKDVSEIAIYVTVSFFMLPFAFFYPAIETGIMFFVLISIATIFLFLKDLKFLKQRMFNA